MSGAKQNLPKTKSHPNYGDKEVKKHDIDT
uniref:Uncharacterized protein n=1 Tax=Arundo donax TaxID=35708 RepID=A0A0A9BLS5_ARUDO